MFCLLETLRNFDINKGPWIFSTDPILYKNIYKEYTVF